MVRRSQKKELQKKIVQRHIDSLFRLQQKEVLEDFSLARRYSFLIRRISMKFNHHLPREIKRSYCKYCKTPLVPGRNCRVRVQRGKVIYTCFECNKQTRIPYVKEQKARRKKQS